MSRIYDNWERLVEATLKREQLHHIALYCESFSSIASDFNGDSFLENNRLTETDISLSPNVQLIAFKELKAATKSFRPEWLLGTGESGNVCKGWIDEHKLTAAKPGDGMAVAVKKLTSKGFQGRKEWLTQICYLRHLHHPNLVKLIGYCFEEDDLLLVYEFMPKGSLDNHLFRRGHESLSWTTRVKVAIGAARGLSFLHGLEKQVIHRNIRASNILLDREFNTKLSGFGWAKDGPSGGITHVSTRVLGAYGYAAPEYVMTGHLTTRCDVYSFGVVLLELLSGRRVIDKTKVSVEQNLVEWARPLLMHKRKLFRIMDPKLEVQYSKKEAHSAAILAYRCLSRNPKARPRMTEVLVALEPLQGPKTEK
ncbi:hypothetical protein Pfo_024042 [Paulownia fortunei]|nr:hypothetical protein Pfo_024042 [Paulownia fortunei]